MTSNTGDPRMEEIKSEYQDEVYPEDDSDVDHEPSSVDLFQLMPLDYWYGKKHFEAIIAKELFLNLPPVSSIIKIDSRFEELIRTFPYGEASRSLKTSDSKLFRSNQDLIVNDEYSTLLKTAGMTIRQGTEEEKALLMGTIRKFIGATGSSPPRSTHQGPNGFPASSSSPPPPMGPPPAPVPENGANNATMGYYSLRLKEKADIRGIKLEYNIERNPRDPETFRAQLSLYGRTFVGIGRSKPLAKHQASKDACAWLDSRPENTI